MQKANLDGAPYVNLVKIEQAIEEVVTGNNYAVVFSAEKGYPFLREPDNGRCFFTMFKSKDVDENAAPEVTKYVCVLVPGKE
uniref:Uncharacterized protein n=1 Tax=Romanomermis culicivorax TaxID=13658 RepID=A0A915KC55_ROMCU